MLDERTLAGIDEGIKDLVIALNKIRGIETISSCEGHENYNPHFSVVGFKATKGGLKRLAHRVLFTETGEIPYTQNRTATKECIDGYWIEVRYDICLFYVFYVLMIYSPDKVKRMDWIKILLNRLEGK